MMEQAAIVVEAEQQRAHAPTAALVAEPADDTVGSTQMLDLEHGAFPRPVGQVQALRHDPVDLDVAADEPCFRFPQVASERRERQAFALSCFARRASRAARRSSNGSARRGCPALPADSRTGSDWQASRATSARCGWRRDEGASAGRRRTAFRRWRGRAPRRVRRCSEKAIEGSQPPPERTATATCRISP